jgi:hypothetical protein
MSYQEASHFAGPMGPLHSAPNPYANSASYPAPDFQGEAFNGLPPVTPSARVREQETISYHGEALARDVWAEQRGPWIVLGFTCAFALFLISMLLAGQAPGQSFLLKSLSDIFQFVGEGIGFFFCVRIAARLYGVSNHLRRNLLDQQRNSGARRSSNELAVAHVEAQSARRAFLAWLFLAIAIAFYASGQAVWTSYDIRMNSADVPFPGIYDIGFVVSFPFFLLGTLFLTRRNKASVGRIRLVLDALAVVGTALALSWFFLLGPVIAGLAQAPSSPAAILSVYFPTADLFLVAVGAFLMFSPLANRTQQPVFVLLCLGLFFLAITDSLLAYYSLSFSFNTGTLQDLLWPLSMSLVGLAAIEYPRSIAREQEQAERMKNARVPAGSHANQGRLSQISLTAQTIAPFILVLATCALLLTQIAPRGGAVLLQADLVALALILIVIARQALTLLENNRLAMQMRGELVISRRELQVTRREADEAVRTVQDKQVMEEGIATLRQVHARVARGDFSARAPSVSGPLLPIAISLNLMLDRLSSMSQRGSKYDQLVYECRLLQEAIERVGQGLSPLSSEQQIPASAAELRSAFLGLAHLHRIRESQWRRVGSTLESMNNLTQRINESLHEIRHSRLFKEPTHSGFEGMVLDRVIRETDLLGQQERTLLGQVVAVSTRSSRGVSGASREEHPERIVQRLDQAEPPLPRQAAQEMLNGHSPYNQRVLHPNHILMKPLDE